MHEQAELEAIEFSVIFLHPLFDRRHNFFILRGIFDLRADEKLPVLRSET
jgi:hypothetical protein